MINPDPYFHLHYLKEGDGDPVILVHGMAASNRQWQLLLGEIAQNGWRAYAPDLPGHGDSPKAEAVSQYTALAVYTTFEKWLNSLGFNPPVRLVGHSLGGFLCLLYAFHHPQQVASLALIDPYYSPAQLPLSIRLLNRRPGLASWGFQRIPSWAVHLIFDLDLGEAHHFNSQVRHAIAGDYLRASPKIIYLGASIWDLTPILPEIKTPTLLIWGDRDRTLKPTSFPRLALQMPQVEISPVAGSGHQPHIGKAAQVNRRVIDFFQRW